MDKTKADYVVLFDRRGGKGYARKRDKSAVFKKDGDVLYSGSTRSVGKAVQDSCQAIDMLFLKSVHNSRRSNGPH